MFGQIEIIPSFHLFVLIFSTSNNYSKKKKTKNKKKRLSKKIDSFGIPSNKNPLLYSTSHLKMTEFWKDHFRKNKHFEDLDKFDEFLEDGIEKIKKFNAAKEAFFFLFFIFFFFFFFFFFLIFFIS